MKKLLLLTTILTTATLANAQFGELENGQFEDWTNTDLYENPDNWKTGNQLGYITTTKETDAQNGSYSARMESSIIDGDTLFGFVINGDIEEEPEGGFPYTDVVDTLKGWYKYDIQTGDSATVILVMFNADTVTEMVLDLIDPGTQNTWTQFSYDFNSSLIAPDSMLIAFASSNAFADTAVDGSWIMVDNLSFTSSVTNTPAPIPNGDFENWSTISAETPDGYDTFNEELIGASGTPNVIKSTDSYEGTYAAELTTVNLNGDTVPGVITNGDIFNSNGGVEYTYSPTALVGYYKYVPSGLDTGYMSIEFRDNNQTVIDQQGLAFVSNASYTYFNIPLTLSSAPDTMLLTIWSGENPGTVLKVDSLALTGGNVTVEEVLFSGTKLTAYPNPTTDFVTATFNLTEASAIQVQVIDMQGRTVMNENYGSLTAGTQNIQLNVQNLQAGNYFIKLKGDKESIGQKITVQ